MAICTCVQKVKKNPVEEIGAANDKNGHTENMGYATEKEENNQENVDNNSNDKLENGDEIFHNDKQDPVLDKEVEKGIDEGVKNQGNSRRKQRKSVQEALEFLKRK